MLLRRQVLIPVTSPGLEHVKTFAKAVLRGGYMLYPSRTMQTQFLACGTFNTTIAAQLRFLQYSGRRRAALEREIILPTFLLRETENIRLPVNTAPSLAGFIDVSVAKIEDNVYRLTVFLKNTTPVPDVDVLTRKAAQRFAFASAHTIISVKNGAFISQADPPADLSQAAATCRNIGAWPVLVGEEGQTDMMLSLPIMLADYPSLATEIAARDLLGFG